MQIHMVIKVAKPYCETLVFNVAPYLSKIKADAHAKELNDNRSQEELEDYVDYVVESYDIAA